MPNTANGLPYPAPSDPPDGAAQIKALADALPVHRVPTAMAAGQASVSVTTTSGTVAVTFPVGRFTGTPRVMATPAGTSGYCASVAGITANGFTMTARHIDGTTNTATVTVPWLAVEGLG